MPQPVDEFASFTGKKPAAQADEFASFTGKSSAPAPIAGDEFASFTRKPINPDDDILKARADRKAAVIADKAATQKAYDRTLLESQGVFLPDENEPLPTTPPPAAAPPPGTPRERGFLEKIGDLHIRDKIAKFLSTKVQEHLDATAAQQKKMGTVSQMVYSSPTPVGASPEMVVETVKGLAKRGQALYQAFRPNDAKRNAQWAEDKMKDMLDELGDNEPTSVERQQFADLSARARQMWDLSEVERDKRQKAVQDFEERSSKWIAPGTPGAKFIGQAAPMAAQAVLAPETIPITSALEMVGGKNLTNPTKYQTLGRQFTQGAVGYGQGVLMTSGFPGVPAAGVLKAAGVNPLAADIAGMGVSAGANTYSNYLNSKNQTAPMPQEAPHIVKDEAGNIVPGAYIPTLPEAPGLEQYAQDFLTQAAFHAKDAAAGRLGPMEAAPAPGTSGEPIPLAQQLRSLVAPHSPKARLSERESGAAQLKGKMLADRLALDPAIRESAAFAPEHHATADAILEAQSIVAKADAIQQRLNAKVAAGEELTPAEETQLKTGIDAAHPLRTLAATDPLTLSPEARRLIELTQQHQAENAQEFGHATGREGDASHLPRVLSLQAGRTATPLEKMMEFAGMETLPPESRGVPAGARPKQSTEFGITRKFETVETPAGPEVVVKGEPGQEKLQVFGDPNREVNESDVISRRESTKAEIEAASVRTNAEGEPLDPDSVPLKFATNPVAAVIQGRLANRATARGREVLESLVGNDRLAMKGKPDPESKRQRWKSVDSLNITDGAKQRIKEIVTGRKGEWAGEVSLRPDVAQTLVTHFGKPNAGNGLLSGLSRVSRNIVERGLLTNPLAHFTNQFTHGIGALTREGFKGQEAARAISQSYQEGGDPNSAYVAEARAAGVKQMNEGRAYGSGASAQESVTANLEAALGHAPGTLGKPEGSQIKNNIKALNQDMVWRVDDAIRNALYYRTKANLEAQGMSPAEASIKAADHANTHYPGYETKTNLMELNPDNGPNSFKERFKESVNAAYRGAITGKGTADTPELDTVRLFTSPLFHTFRINSAQVLGRELGGAAKGDPKAMAKLLAMGTVGMAYKGALGQQLSDTFLSEDEKKRGKEYRGRVGGPFHFADTALDLAKGETTARQAFFRMAMPSPVAKIGTNLAFGQDLPTGRNLPPFGTDQAIDTAVSAFAGGGDTGRPSLTSNDAASKRDAMVALLGGANIPHPGLKVMLSNIEKTNQPRDYVAAKAQRELMSKLQTIAGDPKLVDETMKAAARDASLQAALAAGDMTINDIKNAAIRGTQTEMEHARAIAKIATPEAVVKAADIYAEDSPRIARALYGDAMKKYGKLLNGKPFGSTDYNSKRRLISNKLMSLPQD